MENAQCLPVRLCYLLGPSPPGSLHSPPSHPTPLASRKVILAALYCPVSHTQKQDLALPLLASFLTLQQLHLVQEECSGNSLHGILVLLYDIF